MEDCEEVVRKAASRQESPWKLDSSSGLTDCQTSRLMKKKLKIPLPESNFSQDSKRANGEVFFPLYHTVQASEWIYCINITHNEIPVSTLEQ